MSTGCYLWVSIWLPLLNNFTRNAIEEILASQVHLEHLEPLSHPGQLNNCGATVHPELSVQSRNHGFPHLYTTLTRKFSTTIEPHTIPNCVMIADYRNIVVLCMITALHEYHYHCNNAPKTSKIKQLQLELQLHDKQLARAVDCTKAPWGNKGEKSKSLRCECNYPT